VKLPNFISSNIALKITSVNAVVISIRLAVSFFVQRYISLTFGEAGHAIIGQIRNIIPMLTSASTLGVFNGVVKYVSQHKSNTAELNKLFSTVFVFFTLGSLLTGFILFVGADAIASKLFEDTSYSYIIKILAFVVPFIALNRIFYAVVNGISDYKSYAKVDLIGYLLGVILLFVALYFKNIGLVLGAITVSPIIQLAVLLIVFGKKLKLIVQPKKLGFQLSFKNQLLAFTLMSFVSTFLLNYVEIDLRSYLIKELNIEEAGNWTAVTNISKNYMVFATGLFSLYVLPKFATLFNKKDFYGEVWHIYKTILPIFAVGMLLVYFLRHLIIDLMYPGFSGMEILFKWQLVGDFIRLVALILAYQFLAKRMVKSFLLTEIVSLVVFYGLSLWFVNLYGTEGIVIAHFVRYIIYFVVVAIITWFSFSSKNNSDIAGNI
jgi:PST family polysaccharide transporter